MRRVVTFERCLKEVIASVICGITQTDVIAPGNDDKKKVTVFLKSMIN